MYATAESRTWTFLKMVAVKENVTTLNFVAYILASGLSICMFVFLSSTQGFVLNQILHINLDTIGNISGNLTLFDECISLILVYLWGILSDRWGRHYIYGAGFLVMGVGLVIYPFASKLTPDLILYRAIFAVGAAATSSMLTAVLADYSSEKDRSKISGIVGLMSGVGALLAVFIFLPMPTKYSDQVKGLKSTYGIVASVSALFGLFLLFALRPKRHVDENSAVLITSDECTHPPSKKISIFDGLKAGFAAARDGKVFLGYLGAFLARGNSIIITIYFPLWVYKYYVDQKICEKADGSSPTIKTDCHEAYIKASILSGIAQTAALVVAPLFGWLGDRLYRPIVVFLATVLGFVSYGWMFFCTNPTDKILFVVVILVGIGEMAIVVSSLSVVTSKAIPSHLRGSISGAYSFAGTIGIMVASKLGGYLFDVWTPTAPFFIMAAGNLIAIFVAAGVVWTDLRDVETSYGMSKHPALMRMQREQDELQLGL
ncbi:unnamed protein product [Aphanomyces euteiches]|uniref:Major facilitator superfamily (MFS) profile domain-containing protein n=1 Tax=Aphanomyces euteiches TaxID=100861 RepID=A0A6G0WN32_9STRA|nr:hypothetical protein Ae201684_013500 [Aphanomyces euteiches]KAH9063099.1 hypothetical protein Ae201684P_009364 [Aphanomyces euteiches]KAH9145160.1 hypothetical protein AeRB84_010928 [Aphanomyces euteiches]